MNEIEVDSNLLRAVVLVLCLVFAMIGVVAGAFVVTRAIEESCQTRAQFRGLDGEHYHCHQYVDYRMGAPR